MVKPKYGSTERLGKSYISLVGSLRDCDDGVRSSWDPSSGEGAQEIDGEWHGRVGIKRAFGWV
jgi:hypothetical protein